MPTFIRAGEGDEAGHERADCTVRKAAGANEARTRPQAIEPRIETPEQVTPSMGDVALLLLVETSEAWRSWGWMQLALRRWPLRAVPGLRFAKILGSGHEGGFGLRPSFSRQGLFLGFADEASARSFADDSPLATAYRTRARECVLALLRAATSRGTWDGAALRVTADVAPGQPIATLTRASIRGAKLADFWQLAPASEEALARAPGCRLAVGLGEAPLVRQCTFSVWDNAAALTGYARSGAHLRAIRAATSGHFFSEAMFVRFAVLALQGRWKGLEYGLSGAG